MVFFETDYADSMAEMTNPLDKNPNKKEDYDTNGVPVQAIGQIETTKPGKTSYRDIPRDSNGHAIIEEGTPEDSMEPRPSQLSVESIAKLTDSKAVDVFTFVLEKDKQ